MAKAPARRTAPNLEQTVVREFTGGWNTVDNELNLTPKFAKVMDNWVRAPDGSMQLRYGYKLYADCSLINVDDDVLLTGDIVNGIFFQGYLIVVDTDGNVARISNDNTGIRIWDSSIAASQTDSPAGWGPTTIVNFFSNAGKLIILNGVNSPLEVDSKNTPICQYLADPSTGSNFGIPKGAFGISDAGYAIIVGDTDAPTTTHISAKYENGVFGTNEHPDDAVDVDMSKITSSVDAEITGIGQLRGTLVITYRDGISLGTLGITTTSTDGVTVHQPTFDDQVSQSGCIAHRSIASLGNDMFLCDRVGVPSLSRSTFGQLIPDRVSQLIEPDLQRNISRLTELEATRGIFAVFNPREKQYMLFVPKFTEQPIPLTPNPISTMAPDDKNSLALYHPNHQMEEGDTFTLSGCTDLMSDETEDSVVAVVLNGNWTVTSVLDENNVRLTTPNRLSDVFINGGGDAVVLTHTGKERVGYIFTYNPKLKIQSWARFRGMKFSWGAVDLHGRTYFGVGKKVYVYGTTEEPLAADRIDDYDATWQCGTHYTVDELVYDVDGATAYKCLVEHTSRPTGTFAQDRASLIDHWEISRGVAIDFAWEWPWGDFGARSNVKAIRAVKAEAQGQGGFNLAIFVDNRYTDAKTGTRTPVRQLDFVPNEAPAFGVGPQPYGAGRRTKDMKVWPIPVNCNIYKLRFEGSTTEPLRIVSVSLLYHKGGLAR